MGPKTSRWFVLAFTCDLCLRMYTYVYDGMSRKTYYMNSRTTCVCLYTNVFVAYMLSKRGLTLYVLRYMMRVLEIVTKAFIQTLKLFSFIVAWVYVCRHVLYICIYNISCMYPCMKHIHMHIISFVLSCYFRV